jgi:HEAT repeat protein
LSIVGDWDWLEMNNASFLEFFLYGDSAVVPLINNLKSEDAFVKKVSVILLQHLRDERSVEPLIEKLKDNSVQVSAAWALALIKDKRAFLPLVTALKEKELMADAIPALGKLEDWRAVDPLLERLDDEDPEIRKSVANALGYFYDTRVAEALFERLINDRSDDVKWEISRVIKRMLSIGVPHFSGDIAKMDEWWREWWSKNRDKVEIIIEDEREKRGLNSQ